MNLYVHVNEEEVFCTEWNDHKWNRPLNKDNE